MVGAVVYVKIRVFFLYDAVYFGRHVLIFGRNLQSSSGQTRYSTLKRQQIFLPWTWRQQVNSKHQNISNKLHGITFQKTIIHEHKFLNHSLKSNQQNVLKPARNFKNTRTDKWMRNTWAYWVGQQAIHAVTHTSWAYSLWIATLSPLLHRLVHVRVVGMSDIHVFITTLSTQLSYRINLKCRHDLGIPLFLFPVPLSGIRINSPH
jgi:hypothetical protein